MCVVSLVIALLVLMRSRGTWDDYGRRGLTFDSDRGGSAEPPPGSPAEAAQREAEIRELLEARNARRARRGEERVDIEADVSRLKAAGADAKRGPEAAPPDPNDRGDSG